jgi:hypothetical protein
MRTFLMRILSATARSEDISSEFSIVIRRPYAYLLNDLSSEFQREQDVRVFVDRRRRERRSAEEFVGAERRRLQRRRASEEIVEIVLSG